MTLTPHVAGSTGSELTRLGRSVLEELARYNLTRPAPRTTGSRPSSEATMSEPFLGLWFGNFFEPFLSDQQALRRGVAEIADLGFTSVNLDSKPWEDFFARYRGEPASPYVAGQELIMDEAERHGLDHTHLALYLCGDNLYPAIRDTPPVRGREAVLPDGSLMHLRLPGSTGPADDGGTRRGLLQLYGKRMHRRDDGRVVMQTMFEPLPRPSFDERGTRHHLSWLARRYDNDPAALGLAYGLQADSFDNLRPHERCCARKNSAG